MFKGHKFVKLVTGNWVFDLTEFIGYKVSTENNNNITYEKAFKADLKSNNGVEYVKYTGVPVQILRESNALIGGYVGIRG